MAGNNAVANAPAGGGGGGHNAGHRRNVSDSTNCSHNREGCRTPELKASNEEKPTKSPAKGENVILGVGAQHSPRKGKK